MLEIDENNTKRYSMPEDNIQVEGVAREWVRLERSEAMVDPQEQTRILVAKRSHLVGRPPPRRLRSYGQIGHRLRLQRSTTCLRTSLFCVLVARSQKVGHLRPQRVVLGPTRLEFERGLGLGLGLKLRRRSTRNCSVLAGGEGESAHFYNVVNNLKKIMRSEKTKRLSYKIIVSSSPQ